MARGTLLHSARFWEAHERGDLALAAMKKLAAARPDSPEALLELGELELRVNNFTEAAQVERDLSRRFKGSQAASEFGVEYRIATRDRLPFAAIRRQMEIGHPEQARAALERLFPDGAPGGALGIDYYLLLANTPQGLAPALEGFKRLAAHHPDDPRYQLALARLMLRQPQSALAGLKLLETLARRDDVRADDVDDLLQTGILRLGVERAPVPSVRAYLARHPDDAEVTALARAQRRASEERELLRAATRDAVLPDVQRRLARELSAPARSSESRLLAGSWLKRSESSHAAHRDALSAVELRAALAYGRGDYESQISLAEELEAQGAVAEADELLAGAAGLAPTSSWLFETRVRWLLAHGRAVEAVDLLRARTPNGKWTAPRREALLASALSQRATELADAGRVAEASADLEESLQLAPREPWVRYRLAKQYSSRGAADRGRTVLGEGVRLAPDDLEMHFAQALYLAGLEDFEAAYAAIDATDGSRRSAGMNALHDRMQVALARAAAKRLDGAGDVQGARAALLAAEPVASHDIDRAAELAQAWIDLGRAEHGLSLVRPYLEAPDTPQAQVLLTWAQLLNSADDNVRLGAALLRLEALAGLNPAEQREVKRLERARDLRMIRGLERAGNLADAERRIDALLAREPQDRELRLARADLDLAAGRPGAARDRYASLAAEDPDDLGTRLAYVRALTEAGDLALARVQLHAVEAADPRDEELQLSMARRQLALSDAQQALRTLAPLLDSSPPRADALMLAARAELTQRNFALARGYFDQVAHGAGTDDALTALQGIQSIDERSAGNVAAGSLLRHQPGTAGMSQLDAVVIPSSWLIAANYESRFVVRADAVLLDAGHWSTAPSFAPLLGTIPTAGGAALRYQDSRQRGLSPSLGYQTDVLAADVGSTPLGFVLPKVVGGIEWTPKWHSADVTLGLARRAVTSSELSYAGVRDPVTGTPWGGVVQTGPYASIGWYRDNYDFSGSLQWSDLTGTRVLSNQYAGARAGASWKIFARPDMRADTGLTINYWNFQHNLAAYTFGSGGYYSPQSYVSLAAPVELTGDRAGWAYRVRVSPSYSVSQIRDSAFYPNDPALQAAASAAVLPAGYSSPFFSGYHSRGFGFSAYAASERLMSEGWVVGFMLSIDRTDYYHPSTVEIYFRHGFAPWTTHVASPPRPLRPYSP